MPSVPAQLRTPPTAGTILDCVEGQIARDLAGHTVTDAEFETAMTELGRRIVRVRGVGGFIGIC